MQVPVKHSWRSNWSKGQALHMLVCTLCCIIVGYCMCRLVILKLFRLLQLWRYHNLSVSSQSSCGHRVAGQNLSQLATKLQATKELSYHWSKHHCLMAMQLFLERCSPLASDGKPQRWESEQASVQPQARMHAKLVQRWTPYCLNACSAA